MAKEVERIRVNLDPRGGPTYVGVREDEYQTNTTDMGLAKGTAYGQTPAPMPANGTGQQQG